MQQDITSPDRRVEALRHLQEALILLDVDNDDMFAAAYIQTAMDKLEAPEPGWSSLELG